jgi:myxalamid-type polyketide synthase MxaC
VLIRGIFHAAGVLDDVLIRDMSPERFAAVFAPKVVGAWNLHTATLNDKLDFFILFSSIAAIHPQPGMGIYAAANACLDAFARYRRALTLPATAINWGGWDQIGMARIAGTERSLDGYREQGIRNLTASEALEALGEAIRRGPAQLAAIPVDWKAFAEFHGGRSAPLFQEFVARAAATTGLRASGSEIAHRLAESVSAEERVVTLEGWLQETLGRVLKLATRKIDLDRPMGTMGLDSLMGVEFVRRISNALEIPVPATVVFNYPTIRLLAQQLLKRLNPADAEDSSVSASVAVAVEALPDISEEEALQALMKPQGSSVQ